MEVILGKVTHVLDLNDSSGCQYLTKCLYTYIYVCIYICIYVYIYICI